MLISAPTPCSSRVFQYMAHVMLALFIYQEDGEPKSMLATHVDDMLWPRNLGTRIEYNNFWTVIR